MTYEVHLDVFDGPFELLLQLITAQQVDLYEVSLSAIVDGFLAEMTRLDHLDLEATTQFLLIAATLVELKCRRLLPGPDDVELDDDLSLLEARDYLLARLLECRTFAKAAERLADLESDAARAVARRAGPDERFEGAAPDLLEGLGGDDLGRAFARVLARANAPRPAPDAVSMHHVHDDEVSVAWAMSQVVMALRARGPGDGGWTRFRELTEATASIAHTVACFLALLELYKQSLVDLDQAETFGELQVRWVGGDVSLEAMPTDDYDDLAMTPGVAGS